MSEHRPTDPPPSIRPATVADLDFVNDLRNHYARTCTAIYTSAETSIDERRAWFDGRGPMHPVTVAELDGRAVGWASLSPLFPHGPDGYAPTAEDSVYVAPDAQGRGVGSALLGDLISRASAAGLHAVVARIDSGRPASLALHRKHGFAEAGRLPQVARKFNRWLDVVLMHRLV